MLDLEGDGGAAFGGDALLLLERLARRTGRDLDVLVEAACARGGVPWVGWRGVESWERRASEEAGERERERESQRTIQAVYESQ